MTVLTVSRYNNFTWQVPLITNPQPKMLHNFVKKKERRKKETCDMLWGENIF